MVTQRHSFVVMETSLPAEGTIRQYRGSRARRPSEPTRGGSIVRAHDWALLAILALVWLLIAPAAAHAALLGEWTFDEGAGQVAHDRAPLRLDGHLGLANGADGADPAWVPGVAGWGLRFDGGDAVMLRDSAALEPANLTIETWVRRRGTPGAFAYIVSKDSLRCDFSSYGLYTGANRGLAFYVSDGSSYVASPAAGASRVWDGAWHHVAGTFDGHRVRLYLDGAEVGAGSPNDHRIQYGLESKAAYIGSYQGSCALGFTGDIDDVRIWDSALTGAEISASLPTQPLAPARPVGRSIPPVSSPPPAAITSCVVTANRKALRPGRRNRLVVVVRRDTRRLRNVRVLVRGTRLRQVRRAGRDGRVRFVVRPRRSERRLQIRALGPARRCAAATIPVGA